MKYYILSFCIILLFSCKNKKEKHSKLSSEKIEKVSLDNQNIEEEIPIDTTKVIQLIKQNYYSIKSQWDSLYVFVDGVGSGETNVPVIIGGYQNYEISKNPPDWIDLKAYNNAEFKIFSVKHFEGDFLGINNHYIAVLKNNDCNCTYEFYVKDGRLYFVFMYDKRKNENRFYFDENEYLIRWINKNGKILKYNKQNFTEKEKEIKKLLDIHKGSVRRN